MKFEDVVADLEKLRGRRLNSIRPGAELELVNIDRQEQRIELRTASDQDKTRPLSELRRIWEELRSQSAVHVDSVLGGSGSSRNQPETLLANLPYIEWLNIGGRKHIAFTGRDTHEPGTLRKMDALDAEKVRQHLRAHMEQAHGGTVIFIASDIAEAARALESVTGMPLKAIKPGIYQQDRDNLRTLLVSSSLLSADVPLGAYVVIQSTSIPRDSATVSIADQTYLVVSAGGINLMLPTN